MSVPLPRAATWLRDRIESGSVQRGLIYPWWIAVSCAVLTTGATVLGALQRDLLLDPRWMSLAPVLVLIPYVLQFTVSWWLPWWITLTMVGGAAGWLLTEQAGAFDLVPAALAVVVAGITATDGLRIGAVAAAVGLTVLAVSFGAELDFAFYGMEVLLGFFVGAMLRWQMRALVAEHVAREEDRDRAVLAERQRIAREVHDLVAHSLSVTMLHVTGARRALSDAEPDVADAIDALTDAERIGRQAMTDIRRTVGLLANGPGEVQALPGGADVPTLVADSRAAGMDITFTCRGDLDRLPPAAGLGVYRVVQESVANAVKHAAGAPVVVELDVSAVSVQLTVRNPVTERRRSDNRGSGLAGMRARADQLEGTLDAGARDGHWYVDLTLPLAAEARARTDHSCAVRRSVAVRRAEA